MGLEQDLFFWNTVGQLIDQKFRVITMSDDQQEIWLESAGRASFPLVRLVRTDADWGNRLGQDIERTAAVFEEIRRNNERKSLSVLNLYFSTEAPVDEWEHIFSEPYSFGKTVLKNELIHGGNRSEKLQAAEDMLSVRLDRAAPPIRDYHELQAYQAEIMEKEKTKMNEEKKLFEYGKPKLTKIFLTVQIVVFLMMELAGGSQNNVTLLNFGAKYNPSIIEGEWWRLITPMFLHIGFLHLAMNSVALYFIGEAVEKMFGSFRFLLIYFFAGAMGTLASFAFSPAISAGASGAIFGCFGALLYLGAVQRELFLRTIGPNILVVIGINLALGFAIPNIDNAGHIGGLIGGAAAAFAVQLPSRPKSGWQAAAAAGGIGLAVLLAAIGFTRWQ
ncbi:rhomboid family intramembrane serine protease [Bacillus mangrovi]|uniref:Rhomboid family intramembrane serine protease n=1 Tax=Metabacillus mangrovi TaxID=1491830 RepID=A0A7X2S433_9BACI|nr:rhomboid family intramembrane serine protease [Metabacillus mangrovi]MTH52416.1 rhomboid family intramembrane serine protease [Metabacillus mangrovi]